MVIKVMDGISNKLEQVFGGIRVFSDEKEQEGADPFFYIANIKTSNASLAGSRSLRRMNFVIRYFPEVLNSNYELQTMASNLYDVLEYIVLENGDMLRGTKMSHEVVDGYLLFYVNYNMHIRKVEDPEENMEKYKINNNVKG